ncbi:MAG: VOC family protein [Acidimicrobiales bacterium]
MIRGVHHVSITTPDIDRLVDFYSEAFGFEVLTRGGWEPGNKVNDSIVGLENSSASTAFLRGGNVLIEMFEYHQPPGQPNEARRPVNNAGYTHFCVDVTDIDSEVARLEALGMEFHAPVPAAEDMSGVMRAMYGRDTDGNIIELIEFVDTTVPTYVDYGASTG